MSSFMPTFATTLIVHNSLFFPFPFFSLVDFVAMFDHLTVTRRGDDFVIIELNGMPDFEEVFASVKHGDIVIACQKTKLKSNRQLSFCQGQDKLKMDSLVEGIDNNLELSSRGLHWGVSMSLKTEVCKEEEEQGVEVAS
jgi:hypothetical protein